MQNNIILNTDSYKVSMWKQYPPGTENVFSYIESRGGVYDRGVFFGLQAFIKQYLTKPITLQDIDEAEQIWTAHGEPFNREGWIYILKKHAGRLPLRIRAVKEGTVVPVKNVLATFEVTDPKCFWLTTYVETAALRAVWYGTTVATQSWSIKQLIRRYLKETGDEGGLSFKLHDFGSRGVSSEESAGIGAAAHLINFMGTDTMSGVLFAMRNYNAGVCGFSIPAAEHSTITSWGRENEAQAYRNMIKQFAKPGSLVAIVSDSYNVFNAAENIFGSELKTEIEESGATVVIRPDSGDPVDVNLKLVKILGDKFGYTTNDKGFKVLKTVRLIQGDGVNYKTIGDILEAFKNKGWSADNIAFGMGGALLQQINRDTMKFAMKCSAIKVNGEWRDVQKDPITDQGKKSKAGLITLWTKGGEFETSVNSPKRWTNMGFEWKDALEVVFEDGNLLRDQTFDEIRALSNNF